VPIVVLALAGCATAYGRGELALRSGHYDEAARHFEQAIGADPDRAEALLGLGIARYKLGELPQASTALEEAVRHAPGSHGARLYLGLALLRAGERERAVTQLAALRDLGPHPRLTAQLARAQELIRTPLPDAMRDFIVAGLEHELEWQLDVIEARRTARGMLEPSWTTCWDDVRVIPPVVVPHRRVP
jgi:tetratricopeptide (TPR) repeat protein